MFEFFTILFLILNVWAVCLGNDEFKINKQDLSRIRFLVFLRKLPGYKFGRWLSEVI